MSQLKAVERHRQSGIEQKVQNSKGRYSMKVQAFIYTLGVLLTLFLVLPTHVQAESFDKIHKGDSGEKVEWLQSELVERGYLEDDHASDVFDEKTMTAVSSFQESLGLHVDGIAGKQTLGAMKILNEGSEGPLVEELQTRLAELNYYGAAIDGKFGPLTKAAVLAFQTQNGLMTDGVAGPQTHKFLYYNETTQSKQVKQTSQAPTEQKQASSSQASASEPKQSSEPKQASEQKQASEAKQSNESSETNESNEAKSEDKTASASSSSEDSSNSSSSESETKSAGKTMQMEATAYTAYCNGCSGVTRTGIDLRANPNQKVVAVDPNVIPLGTRVHVEGYGEAIAGDTGGAIKGNKIDLYVQTKDEAYTFGRQQVEVTILD